MWWNKKKKSTKREWICEGFEAKSGYSVETLNIIKDKVLNEFDDEAIELLCLHDYSSDRFNFAHTNEIFLALCNGLTRQQILYFEKTAFWPQQKRQIRLGFENGLYDDQIALYAKPEFDETEAKRSEQIRLGCKNGLEIEQVEYYAKSCFDVSQMTIIRKAEEIGVKEEYIHEFFSSKFNGQQMNVIYRCFVNKMDILQIKKIANYRYDVKKMEEMAKKIELSKASIF